MLQVLTSMFSRLYGVGGANSRALLAVTTATRVDRLKLRGGRDGTVGDT
jgi:hypothetical protein